MALTVQYEGSILEKRAVFIVLLKKMLRIIIQIIVSFFYRPKAVCCFLADGVWTGQVMNRRRSSARTQQHESNRSVRGGGRGGLTT